VIERMRKLGESAAGSWPGRAIRKFVSDRAANQAVLIAWNALFAMFPTTLALAAIGGAILSAAGAGKQDIEGVMLSIIPSQAGGEQAAAAVKGVQQHSGLLGVIALLGFLWSASTLFGALEQSLGVVFNAQPRGFVPGKLMALGLMVLFVGLACIGVASSTAVVLLAQLPLPQPAFVKSAVTPFAQAAVGVLAGFVLFLVIYYVVPNRRQQLGEVWPGALFAGIGFKLLTLLFPLYIELNRGMNQYGSTFALLFILLTFFYFVGLLTVMGAEINAVRNSR
jgi:membrane protein